MRCKPHPQTYTAKTCAVGLLQAQERLLLERSKNIELSNARGSSVSILSIYPVTCFWTLSL